MSHRIVAAGDSAIVVEFEARIDPAINALAIALAEAVQGYGGGRRSRRRADLPVGGDSFRSAAHGHRRADRADRPGRRDRGFVAGHISFADSHSRVLRKRVRSRSPAVAAYAGCSEQAVVLAHTETTYRVFMLGFVPGFAYLGIVDQRIAMPRHAVPRVRVPARSVAIAGVQTGIYPSETPGGWQLIGRTPLPPFDPDRPEPFLMKAGDAVQFYAIDGAEYERVERDALAGRHA
jgi:allophanate hydrolase subunit 1